MKCVVAAICPEAQIIDITHAIPPFDVRAGAYAVKQAAPFSPPGSIHVVVVDPGVGTPRRPLGVRSEDRLYLAPDNGVLSWQVNAPNAEIRQLNNDALWLSTRSATFHGRDLFAPAAAKIAAGICAFEELGPKISDPVLLTNLEAKLDAQGNWYGAIVSIDRFGNVITNVRASAIKPQNAEYSFQLNGIQISSFVATFGDAPPGLPFAYEGSAGYIEIGLNQGNAAAVLGVQAGDPVTLVVNA
jgi:S-adenosylmethionine hydrolase